MSPSRWFTRAAVMAVIGVMSFTHSAAAQNSDVTLDYKWDLNGPEDVNQTSPAHFTTADRVSGLEKDGDVSYRTLKKGAFHVPFVLPAFDFDPKFYDTANHVFYLKIRYKDVSKGRIVVQSYKGGADFYGYCFAGQFGGEADNQWKDAYVVVRRSILRAMDGKNFGFTLTGINGIPDDVPIASVEIYSAACTLPNARQKIAAAEDYDQARREYYKNIAISNPKAKFKQLPLPDPGDAPPMSPQETAAGFRVFFPPITRALFQNSQPQQAELTSSLQWHGVPGQIESHLVVIKAAKDLGQVKIQLKISGPSTIELSPVLRWAEFREYRVGSSWSQDYRVAPQQLLEHSSQKTGPDEIEIACLNVTMPETAKPGDYQGELIVSPEKGEPRTFPVRLTVYPFKLEHPDHSTHACFYYASQGSTDPVELIDMRNHGIDSLVDGIAPSIEVDAAGKPKNIDNVRKEWATLKQLGFKSPIFINIGGLDSLLKKDKEKEYVALIKLSKELAEEGGFTDTPFFPVDEPHTDVLVAKTEKAFKWTREVPGARTYVTANPHAVDKLGSLLDDVSYNIAYMNQKNVDGIQKSGQTLMYYAGCVRVEPEHGRFRCGFYLNRTGARNVQLFAYYAPALDPLMDLDGGNHDWTPVFPSRNSPFHDPTITWEAVREGVNDYAYAYTLQAMAERAAASGHAAAAETARKVLNEVVNSINLDATCTLEGPLLAIEADTSLKNQKLDAQAVSQIHNQMDASWYDASREKIAAAIIELQSATR